jgi:hypothetical protein
MSSWLAVLAVFAGGYVAGVLTVVLYALFMARWRE